MLFVISTYLYIENLSALMLCKEQLKKFYT